MKRENLIKRVNFFVLFVARKFYQKEYAKDLKGINRFRREKNGYRSLWQRSGESRELPEMVEP
jgi:hypothetical protein